MTKAMMALGLSLASSSALADWQVNLNQGVTEISRDIFDLHMLIFWICVVIGVHRSGYSERQSSCQHFKTR